MLADSKQENAASFLSAFLKCCQKWWQQRTLFLKCFNNDWNKECFQWLPSNNQKFQFLGCSIYCSFQIIRSLLDSVGHYSWNHPEMFMTRLLRLQPMVHHHQSKHLHTNQALVERCDPKLLQVHQNDQSPSSRKGKILMEI